VVIEVDSPWHDTQFRREFDARKQAILEAHGITVIRLRKEDAAPTAAATTVSHVWDALADERAA
jgi:very-short-patch-repair endonuclease